ncbi:aspartate 1-decarboxylase [Abditibacteriota bacterium]|nr:aspartate 1-decarboxylase [Abditibacteriota bacterium]
MLRTLVKAKIHRATVTQADLNYVGSLTIDLDLMEMCDILPNEQVHIVNVTNGHRMVTYAIEGERGSGVMCLNGAAARHGQKGDIIIVMTFGHFSNEEARSWQPQIVVVDGENRAVEKLDEKHGAIVTRR